NTVRRHLSALKGGGLARAARGQPIRLYAVSDVRGDPLHDVGSGPVSPDPTRSADALAVLERHALAVPAAVRTHLKGGAGETAKPGEACFARLESEVVASLDAALDAAGRAAEARGLATRVLRAGLYGEVEAVAHSLAAEARAHPGTLV